jgi:hypothetical protein
MTHRMKQSAIGLTFCAVGVLGVMAPAWSASKGVDAQYREDVERCKSGASGQEKSACFNEARASLMDRRRRSGLTDPIDAQRNATERCNALPAGPQRHACMIQMSGQGNTRVQGSVAGGGILRETLIQAPAGTPDTRTSGPGSDAVPPPGYGTPAPTRFGTMPRQ